MHRSYLYVPGDRPDRLDKALASGADAVIADLEDGVAPAAKDRARRNVAAFLADATARGARSEPTDEAAPEVLVRVNNDDRLAEDLAAVARAGGRAVYLPKAELMSLDRADRLLRDLESPEAGTPVALVALIESARGVLDAEGIAEHPRVRNLAVGEADLTAELAIEPSADARELWAVRSSLVVASAAARIDPPTAPVNTDFSDLDALREDTEALRRAGFGARSAIHPAQVAVLNEVFTPSAPQVRAAQDLVALFDAAMARGDGACVDARGRMVDEAVVRSARRVLARRR